MATQSSNAGKQGKSADVKREAPVRPSEESTRVEASVVGTPGAEAAPETAGPAPVPVPVTIEREPRPGTVVAPGVDSVDADAFSASFEFDAALWSKKSFELWAENASAFLDFAEEIAKARTFEEVVELQSRFASDRFDAFMRQSKELMEFVRGMSSLAAGPLCDTRKAA